MKEYEWTNTQCKQLIEAYKNRPELWDTKHERYRHQTSKYERWLEIAALFNLDIGGVRKKLNSILASHRRECMRLRNGTIQSSNWYAYRYMSFLPAHIHEQDGSRESTPRVPDSTPVPPTKTRRLKREIPRPPIREIPPSSSEPESETEYLEFSDADSDGELKKLLSSQDVVYVQDDQPETSPPSPKRKKPTVTGLVYKHITENPTLKSSRNSSAHGSMSHSVGYVRKSTSLPNDRVSEALNLLGRTDLTRKKDECDSFGEYIADSLRKHDERTQSMIKQAINNIIFEQEMKKYSNTNQYTVVLAEGCEDNPLILGDREED